MAVEWAETAKKHQMIKLYQLPQDQEQLQQK